MARKYECIGGPLCGEKYPLFPGLPFSQAFGNIDEQGEAHFYRLCIVRDTRNRVARFWHYLGNTPNPHAPPSILPPERMFKEEAL